MEMNVLAINYTLEPACFGLWDFPGKNGGQRERKGRGMFYVFMAVVEPVLNLVYPLQGHGFVSTQ